MANLFLGKLHLNSQYNHSLANSYGSNLQCLFMVHNSFIAFCYMFYLTHTHSLSLHPSLSIFILSILGFAFLNNQRNICWEKTWHLSVTLMYFFYHLCVRLKRLLILKFQWKWASFPFSIIKYYRIYFIIFSLRRFLLWQMAKTLKWVRKLHMLYFNLYASRLCSSPKMCWYIKALVLSYILYPFKCTPN